MTVQQVLLLPPGWIAIVDGAHEPSKDGRQRSIERVDLLVLLARPMTVRGDDSLEASLLVPCSFGCGKVVPVTHRYEKTGDLVGVIRPEDDRLAMEDAGMDARALEAVLHYRKTGEDPGLF